MRHTSSSTPSSSPRTRAATLAVIAAVLVATSQAAATSASPASIRSTANALHSVDTKLDLAAEAYASDFGVSIAEAARRLELQSAYDALIEHITRVAPSRFAGSWVEHQPAFQVVVAFTGTDEGLGTASALAAAAPDLVLRTGSQFSVDQLSEGLARLAPRLDAQFPDVASGIDLSSGSIRLSTPKDIASDTVGDLAALAGVPLYVEIAPSEMLVHTYGGEKLTVSGQLECTAGFTVKHIPSGDKGVLTAGHCANNGIVYHQHDGTTYGLTWKGQFNDSSHDAQWMRELTHAVFDDYWTGSSYTDVAGEVTRANAYGDYVCHMGYGSNRYSCGLVTDTHWDPGDLCGDSGVGPCDNVWLRVQGPSLACFDGDSGGPLGVDFAYGIMKSAASSGPGPGQCSSSTFMSRDFLAGMNLAILTT